MKWKQFLAAGLAGAALLTGGVTAGAFSDTPPAWAADQMTHLKENGVLEGLNTGGATTDPIRRGDFCQLLVNVVQKEMTPSRFSAVPAKESGYFTDIANTVSTYSPGGKNGMYYAAAYGITEGALVNGQRLADTDALLTREQAAKMMCSAIDFLEGTVLEGSMAQRGTARTFTDAASVSSWASAYVTQASALGIMEGDEDGRFNPKGTITWNEAVVMADRAFTSATALRGQQLAGEGMTLLQSQGAVRSSNISNWGDDPLWLIPGADGGYTVVRAEEGQLKVEAFSKDGTSQGIRTLAAELPIFGGFYAGEDGYYAAYGQENKEENDSKEVYRIVKYDRNWNRVGAASINGGASYTTTPYYFTDNTAMAEEDGTLVLHTARLRYASSDGVNHQSNFTALIRTSDMSVLETSREFPTNHVSHSFSEDVIFSDGAPVYADLGDAYPRSFAISQSSGTQESVFSFYGAVGDNTTHAALGGLAASDGCYLLAGASAPQTDAASWKEERMNAMLAVVPKDGFPDGKADIQWLTSFTDGSEWVEDVRLVTVNDNTFVVMWQTQKTDNQIGSFHYALFDGQGRQMGSTQTVADYQIPIGNVVVDGETLSWVRPDFCVASRSYTDNNRGLLVYTLQVDANQATGSAEVSFGVTPSSMELMGGGVPQKLTVSCTGLPAGQQPQVRFVSSDPSVAYVDSEGNVSGRKAGTATVTASMTYRGKVYKGTCAVTVTPEPTLTGLKLLPESATLKVGESLDLTVETVPAGLNPTIIWSYRDSVQAKDNLHAVYTAQETGTRSVTVYTTTDDGRTVTATCTITVTDGTGSTDTNTGTTTPGTGTTNPGTGSTDTGTGTTDTNTGTTKPGTGSTGTSGPASDQPYDTDVYREDYGSGHYLEVRVLDSTTVEFSGCVAYDPAYYNYVVAWAPRGNKAEVPYVSGQPFRTTVQVDTSSVRASAQEGKVPYLTAMVCQNYEPGDDSLAGVGFQKANIGLVPDGDGFLLHIMPG